MTLSTPLDRPRTGTTAPCNLCGDSHVSVLFHARDYEHGIPGEWTVVRCERCGLVFQDPLPSQEALATFYPADYSAYSGDSPIAWMFRVVYAHDAKRIAALVGPEGSVLDFGCGDGSALLELRRRGRWRLCGLEFDGSAVARACASGLDVRQGELLSCDFEDGSFDLIRMGHVIEHVLDPVATLARAYALLKPGGRLVCETPNTDCLDFRLFGKYWGCLHLPRHLILFNDVNLSRGMRQVGFEIEKIGWGLRPVGWSASIQNVLVDRWSMSPPPHGRVKWYAVLVAAFLPFTVLQALIGKTGVVSIVARKPVPA